MIKWKECGHSWTRHQMYEFNQMLSSHRLEIQKVLLEKAMVKLEEDKLTEPRVLLTKKLADNYLDWVE